MDQLAIDPDALRGHAEQLAAHANSAQARFDMLRSRVEGLSDGFQGRAAARYQAHMDHWHQTALALTTALEELGQTLRAEAEALTLLDEELASGA